MPKQKKTIMRSLTIKELSGVDRPAQIGARALIMKRDGNHNFDPDDYEELTPERVADLMKRGKAALTTAVDDHSHLVMLEDFDDKAVVSGVTTWQDDHQHPWIMMTGDRIMIGTVDGHTHDVAQLSKVTGDIDMTPEEIAAKEKLEKQNAELTAKNERLSKVAKLSGNVKAHFDKLTDEAEQTAFLELTPEAQKAEVDKIEKAKTDQNPVVYTDDRGAEYRKSDDPRLVQMAKDSDADRKALKKSEDAREKDDLEKRAGEMLPFLPGTIEHRAGLLKAAEAIEDEDTRKAGIAALKAGNDANDPAFKTLGSGGGGEVVDGSAEQQLDKMAADLAKKENIPHAQAYQKVLDTQEGAALYEKHTESQKQTTRQAAN